MKQIIMPLEDYFKEKITEQNFGKLQGLEIALAYFNYNLTLEDADKMVFDDEYLRNQTPGNPLLSIKKIAVHYRTEILKEKL